MHISWCVRFNFFLNVLFFIVRGSFFFFFTLTNSVDLDEMLH